MLITIGNYSGSEKPRERRNLTKGPRRFRLPRDNCSGVVEKKLRYSVNTSWVVTMREAARPAVRVNARW